MLIGLSLGADAAHSFFAFGHRVRKPQPVGGLEGLGTSPVRIIRSRVLRMFWFGTGTADKSAFV